MRGKNIIKLFYFFILTTLFLITNQNAFALSTASTISLLNWGGMTITGDSYDISSSITWAASEYSNLGAYARDDLEIVDYNSSGRIIQQDNWGDYELKAAVNNSSGTSSTTNDLLSTQAFAQANGVSTTSAESNADLHRTGNFKLYYVPTDETEYYVEEPSRYFQLSLSVPYTLMVELDGENPWSYSLIELTLSRTVYSSDEEGNLLGDTTVYGYDSVINVVGSGLLEIEAELELGVFYSLNAHLYSAVSATDSSPDTAPVPEPGTLFLLGSGLAGLALYRRRMNKA